MKLALLHSGESFPYEKPFFELGYTVKVFYTNSGSYEKLVVNDYDGYVFTGGSDVTPAVYGAAPDKHSVWDFHRDMLECAVFQIAWRKNKPMIGICRGLQFLSVMMGNQLHQHIEGHHGAHRVETDQVLAEKEHVSFSTNSLHHQAVMNVGPHGRILLRCSTDNHIEAACWGQIDHETVFGVQYHPELMNPKSDGYKWFLRETEKALTNAN